MADGLPYFRLYASDEIGSELTESMSAEHFGAYHRIRCRAWTGNPPGTVPDNDALLARWAGLTEARWVVAKPVVMAMFVGPTDGRWVHPNLSYQWSDVEARSDKARISAQKRWKPDAVALPSHNERTCLGNAPNPAQPNPEEETDTYHPKKEKKAAAPLVPPDPLNTDAFRSRWSEYVAYRKERKHGRLTDSGTRIQWARLAKIGHEAAIEAVGLSIANGWVGIFPEQATLPRGSNGVHKPTRDNRTDWSSIRKAAP